MGDNFERSEQKREKRVGDPCVFFLIENLHLKHSFKF